LPALELDTGQCIAETVAIWEYLEERHPAPALIGATAEDRAEARQWQRRIEQGITENLYNGFRFAEGFEMFKDRLPCEPDAAPGLKRISQVRLRWLDGQLAGRNFIVPDRLTIVDIILYCALDFATGVGQPLDAANTHVTAWFKRIEARPSATASLHPASPQLKLRG
jgi:glutathione S-transferase